MAPDVFAILLFAALLHASWNVLVKLSPDKQLCTICINGSAALLALLLLLVAPSPGLASVPWLVLSCGLQVIYSLLVARTYQLAEMSLVYPLMRGSAPLLVALASVFLPIPPLTPGAWLGIAILCLAILTMAAASRGGNGAGAALALLNACIIAGYTLVDSVGVRVSASPVSYTLWLFFLNGFCLLVWAIPVRRRALAHFAWTNRWRCLYGGIATLLSYGLALWAMTRAPVAIVAALRETAILFGALLALLVLRERVQGIRLVAIIGIATGAIILRLA